MKYTKILLGILMVGLITTSAFAKPERLQIKNDQARAKERTAKTQIRNIDLRNIEDPEARRAIREIMNYLNLQAKG